MRLDPDKRLSKATIQAIVDLFPPEDETLFDDDSILRVAMGVADAATRRACALAVMANPEVGARLAKARRQVVISRDAWLPDERQIEDLRCLAVFAESFTHADAVAVFPDRFAVVDALLPFEARGWIEPGLGDEAGRFRLTDLSRTIIDSPIDENICPNWHTAFALRFAEVSAGIDRILSELRWTDASGPLHQNLPNLRKAWTFADELGMFEKIEHFARGLLVALLELGARAEFEDLLARSYRAAEALARPKFQSWLLSFEGVAAARQGDPERARALWRARVELNRGIPNPIGEADALLDIAAQYHTAGDNEAFRGMVDDLDRAVAASNRADLEARLLALLAVDRLRAGDADTAMLHARKALTVLSGVDGIDIGLSVQFSAAKTIAACGQTWDACDSLTGVLATCVEGGRLVAAAFSLSELGSHFEAEENRELALRCLDLSLAIHRQVGTRYAPAVEAQLHLLRMGAPADPTRLISAAFGTQWEHNCLEILAEIARIRAIAIPTR